MTVILDLSPEHEKRLRTAADARGIAADELASEMLFKALEEFAEPSSASKKRVLGLGALGVLWIAEDFDAPLPDSFWLGEE